MSVDDTLPTQVSLFSRQPRSVLWLVHYTGVWCGACVMCGVLCEWWVWCVCDVRVWSASGVCDVYVVYTACDAERDVRCVNY